MENEPPQLTSSRPNDEHSRVVAHQELFKENMRRLIERSAEKYRDRPDLAGWLYALTGGSMPHRVYDDDDDQVLEEGIDTACTTVAGAGVVPADETTSSAIGADGSKNGSKKPNPIPSSSSHGRNGGKDAFCAACGDYGDGLVCSSQLDAPRCDICGEEKMGVEGKCWNPSCVLSPVFSGDLDALAAQVAAATAAATVALKAHSNNSNSSTDNEGIESTEIKMEDGEPERKRAKHGDAESEGGGEEDQPGDEDGGESACLRYMSSVLGPFPKQLSDARDFEVHSESFWLLPKTTVAAPATTSESSIGAAAAATTVAESAGANTSASSSAIAAAPAAAASVEELSPRSAVAAAQPTVRSTTSLTNEQPAAAAASRHFLEPLLEPSSMACVGGDDYTDSNHNQGSNAALNPSTNREDGTTTAADAAAAHDGNHSSNEDGGAQAWDPASFRWFWRMACGEQRKGLLPPSSAPQPSPEPSQSAASAPAPATAASIEKKNGSESTAMEEEEEAPSSSSAPSIGGVEDRSAAAVAITAATE